MKTVLLNILLMMFVTSLFAQGKWVAKKDKDGIKIYSRTSINSRFDDLKIVVDLPGTVQQLSDILLDVEQYKQWAYGTKISTVIKKVSNTELIYYSEVEVPWPATNRDFYANFKVTLDSGSKSMRVVSSGMKNYQPEKANLVRIPMSKGLWYAYPLSDKKIHLEYILELDPGGSVPGWLLNMFSSKGPLQTFENLKQKMTLLNQ